MTAYCSIMQSRQGFLQVIRKKTKHLKIKNSLWFNLHFGGRHGIVVYEQKRR